jgi:predicted porin
MENFAMKKSLVAIAVLSAFSGAAFAQAAPASSVTLFGIIDTGVRYTNNGGDRNNTRIDVATDGLASSRLGFRGVEDLGGGMRAGFWVEGAMRGDDGTAQGQTWQRRQTVSLLGGFGEIRLGRDYAPTFWNATVFDPFGTNGVGAFSNIHNPHVGIGQFVRNNNTVGYFLPSNLGGIYGQVMVAAGENVAPNKYIGGRIGWQGGPVNVAAAYGQNYVVAAPGSDETAAIANIGAAYTIGPATIMGTYGRFTLGDNTRTNALIGATVKLGPGSLRAAYSRYTNNDDSNGAAAGNPSNNANQVAVGYIYDMSRRTAVYGTVSRISNDVAAGFGATSGGNNGGGVAPIVGKNYTGVEVGVRHSF